MYKIEIDISDWCNEEKVTIETNDFDKVQIIQEFLEFQMENGWAVDYVAVIDEDEEGEEGEDDEVLIAGNDESDLKQD
jgi:hypothetical protein